MIGDALSHSILPGVVFAFLLFGYNAGGFFLGAVVAGIITALGITWAEDRVKTKGDAAIGIVFTAMFSIGVIGISWLSQSEGVHLDLKDFLFGNVLGVSNEDLWLTFAISAYVIFMVVVFYRSLFISTFQPMIAAAMGVPVTFIHYMIMILLSFTVVSALQTVGVILVVALLITPASTALLWTDRLQSVLILSAFFGIFSTVLGLAMAIWLDSPPGPVMVLVATVLYVFSAIFAVRKGLLYKYLRRIRLNHRIYKEDIIKCIFRNADTEPTVTDIAQSLNMSEGKVRSYVQGLKRKGVILNHQPFLKLSQTGEIMALKLIRAHRLWETYLVDKLHLDPDQIHEEAENYEHFLSDELLDEVDELLGSPASDPHGSPIPPKESRS
jgi:ABC-type Mn2+/Zn2+ transport system permease subunit/Mn-dependent DtxR family transcriptional regulator